MGTKVFAIRIGEKYGQDVEDYINSKIPNVTWIREEKDGFKLQWNRLHLMNSDIEGPILTIDIDMLFINDYMKAIEYPIKRGEFLTAKSWWRDSNGINSTLNGGFQKYYPEDCKYIYDEFISRKEFWEEYYIKLGITHGPVNGEQFFIEHMVNKKLKLKYLPEKWFCRMEDDMSTEHLLWLNKLYPEDWACMGYEFNPEIKIVHFMDDKFDDTVIKKFTRFH
tara:strand:+ start:11205 stop:11870 length:666 start_codon:yes stop_codon:yes gene_type:complete